MKYKICYNGAYYDELIIEADTIEEIKEQAFAECYRRGWSHDDCWSEQL